MTHNEELTGAAVESYIKRTRCFRVRLNVWFGVP